MNLPESLKNKKPSLITLNVGIIILIIINIYSYTVNKIAFITISITITIFFCLFLYIILIALKEWFEERNELKLLKKHELDFDINDYKKRKLLKSENKKALSPIYEYHEITKERYKELINELNYDILNNKDRLKIMKYLNKDKK